MPSDFFRLRNEYIAARSQEQEEQIELRVRLIKLYWSF